MSSSTNLTVSDSPFCCSQDCAKATVDAVSTSLSGQTLGSLSGEKRSNLCGELYVNGTLRMFWVAEHLLLV